MLGPNNIVSFQQGKAQVRDEDDYYRRAAEWKAPAGLGRFLGWVKRGRADEVKPALPVLAEAPGR